MSLQRGVAQFGCDARGATAVLFAVSLFPILLAVGFVIDFGLYQNQRAKVQHALDMAGLAAARHLSLDFTEDVDDIQEIARDHFKSELIENKFITMNEVELVRSGMRLNLSVEGKMPTAFMGLAGVRTMSLLTDAEVVYGVPSKAEIALVLDTSNSMSETDPGDTESRISSLRTAAKDMVAALVDENSDTVKMAIVPFSNRVNIGTSSAGASWLSVPDATSYDRTDCPITDQWYTDNCTRDTTACSSDDVSGTCGTWNCDGVDTADADRICTTTTITHTWYGCVEPRSNDNDLQDGGYGTEKIPGLLSRNDRQCASKIQPMTNDVDDLNRTLNTMAVRSETYIPSGLIWGLRMLSKQPPFAVDESIDEFLDDGGIKSIVLMSDGANTLAPDEDGKIDDADISAADPNTKEICQTIKDSGVEIYVVAYNISDATTTKLLMACASSDSRFYTAKSTDALKGVFETITQQMSRDISISG